MVTSVFSAIRIRRIEWLAVTGWLLLLPAASAQQLLDNDNVVRQVCSTNASHTETQGRASGCDSQDIAQLVRSGHAFAHTQSGAESALVLAPGKTIQEARKWFEKAARKGDAAAEVNLALLYINGWGVAQNYGTALYWLDSAASQGNPRAHSNLGILYLNGWGVRRDYNEARKHFVFAAEHGQSGAMVDLGFMNDGGLGIPKNQAEAARWYQRAAVSGDSVGQNNLADMYLRGEGVPQNDALAFAWFQKAAAQGHAGARIKLGFLYLNGRGTSRNLEAAYAWILAASLTGDLRGQAYLSFLKSRLTPEQIERATQRAHELQAQPRDSTVQVAFVR
jgi:uncharacterized protein